MDDDIRPPKGPTAPEPAPKPATPKPVAKDESIVIDEDGKVEAPAPTEPSDQPSATPPASTLSGNFFSRHWQRVKAWWQPLARKWKILIILAALVLACGGGFGTYKLMQTKVAPAIKVTKHTPKSDLVVSPLTGLQITKQAAVRPVTGIMIENSSDARPQSGLQDAGVVYEAIAEAGITRFLAIFQDTAPQYIGPVRSLRPYYIDYAAPYQASIVHVGGSPDALSAVQAGGFRNLDQFANGSYFTRISSRAAPHNVYTNFDQLDSLNQSKGYTSSKFTPWVRKKDSKLVTPTAKTIDLAISGPVYNVHYDYDAATNSYLRSEAGAAHIDLVSASDGTGVQLKPKVVIVLIVPLSSGALDASGAYYSNYTTSGTGGAYIFQDGGIAQVTWSKLDTNSPLLFKDSAGKNVTLNAGQAWVTLVSASTAVTYAP